MKDEINRRFGEALREKREAKGLKRHELAVQLGVTPDTIGNYERGENGPTLSRALAISRILDVRLVDMIKEAA